jgi:hypothetical protein
MESLCYLLSQPYTLTQQDLTVDDDVGSPRTVSLPAGTYRTLLASPTGTGTADDPFDLVDTLQSGLGLSSWTVQMLANGRIRITYIGAGTGEIDLTTTARNILGSTGSATIGPLATNATWTADRQPTHCVFAAAADDGGWQSLQGRAAVQEMPDGSVYGWQDARTRLTRRITLTMLPRDDAARTALGSLSTPAIAEATYRLDPGASAPAQAPPWSVPQTLATAVGARCGWTDDLQAVIAGTTTTFDAVYLGAESHTAPTSLSIPGYDPRRSIGPLMLSWAATESV